MQVVDKVRTKAHLTDKVTELEKINYEKALAAAEEAIVLLENNGVLPLKKGKSVAMFGDGVTNTVKCGSGSGEVNERRSVTIYEGMLKAGFTIVNKDMLEKYRADALQAKDDYFREQRKKAGILNFNVTMASMSAPYRNPPFPGLSEKDLCGGTDTCIFVVSRISGESYDRRLEKGDYYLSDVEAENIRLCAGHYKHLVLIINAGGMIDISAIDDVKTDAVLFMAMLGEAGGEAVANVLSGAVNPSGHLTDTWAKRYEDIPFAMEYSYLNNDEAFEYYKDDIFVGYRYFDTFEVEPKYYFGYGLSYTAFKIHAEATLDGDSLRIAAEVENCGSTAGKEVVQVYASCPDGKLLKEYKRLAGFAKTKSLAPGEKETVMIDIPLSVLSSYSEETACTVLEPGEYVLWAGDSAENPEPVVSVTVDREIILAKHDHICPANKTFEKLTKPEGKESAAKLARERNPRLKQLHLPENAVATRVYSYEEQREESDEKTRELMDKLSVNEMVDLVVGCGNDMLFPMAHYYTVPGATGYSTNKYFKKGIRDIAFCDGPAGLRFQQQAVAVKGKNKVKGITSAIELLNFLPSLVRKMAFGKPEDGTMLYQYSTAFPVGTALAQTWNTELVEETGRAANAELEEYGITMWLAPGMNIHKNPLCGRNYEYYSEDPLLTGKLAAAMTRGVQHRGNHSVSLKHFFCNNQETNRGKVSAEVSERAIREIYLKGFEIAVKEGNAHGVMTSYNRVNGIYSAVNHDAVTKVLRNEWGFDGMVMTDWDFAKPDCEADRSMYAGVDILMQGDNKQKKQIRKALKDGTLDEKYVRICASRVLKKISMLDWE